MNIAVIDDLERRYQLLVNDYQTGTIDETAFVASVDNLQFQDEWGRYWMMGAQTGAWHYYDGQTWHQADPRDADKLPFVDDQGRYWQRGASSGEWYYYDATANEWVKPDQRDPSIPQAAERPGYAPYQSHLRPQTTDAGPSMPSQLDGELFQDDEGRYWMIGAKTGQWYFYEVDGWHPAHEFQYRTAPSQPYQPPYTQPTYPYQAYQQPASYAPPAQQPYAPPYQPPAPQPAYNFPPQPVVQPAPPPAQAYTPPQPQPAQPQAPAPQAAAPAETASPKTGEMPNPPSPKTDSGSWYYFDGKQWLKYSSGEPATDAPPPDPAKIIEQKAEPARPKPQEPVTVAELFEEDDDAIEVVDVEVITIIEAEPDEEPASAPAPRPATTPVAPFIPEDEIRPRRASRPFEPVEPQTIPLEPRRQPRERTSTEPGRPIAPRKPETAHEPTIIIPTEPAASSLGGQVRPTRPISPVQPPLRRPRESTAPINPAGPGYQDLTQPLPQQAPTPRSDTAQVRIARAREDTKEVTPAPKPVASPPPPKTGYSLGDIMRAFPSTFWSLAVGLLVMVIFGIIIIGGYWMLQSNNNLGLGSLGTAQSPTPTMAVAIANATPTPGPTPEATAAPLVTPAPPVTTTFSSAALGFALTYPQAWQTKEDAQYVAFSPSAAGLDPNNLTDTAMWIGVPEEKGASIADILTKVLTRFPADANTLNKGTINIASQTWTSAQISFADKNSGSQGIATLAVTSKEGLGYYLIAVAPAAEWNSAQPLFQTMINSFHFETAAAAAPTVAPSQATTISLTSTLTISPSLTPAEATTPPKPAANATITYTVEAGDTLLGIAVKFGIDTDQLAAKNNITNPNSLRIGQELIIPVSGEQVAAAPVNKNDTTAAGQPITSTQSAADPAAAPTPKPAEAKPAETAPLGGRLVYPAFNPGSNSYDVWLVDVASGKQSVIVGNASQPAFNRDGSLLAYRGWDMSSRGIYFRDFVGGRGGQVTRFVEDGMPTWSPDGFSFAFATRREGDRIARIYRGDQLGEHDYGIGFTGEYPATFPDGRLVVKGCSPAGECGLYVIGANGGGDTKISGEGGDTAPAVSPDGSKIVFMSSARGATNWEIWVMNTDGANPQRLTQNGSNDGLPTWSPDSKSIAFVSDQGGSWAIWAMNADGSNQRKLAAMNGSPDGKIIYAGDDSRGWLEERISWAP